MSSSSSFRGLRAAITGGTSGLGLALVEALSRGGARVAFVARGRDRVDHVRRQYPGTHGIVGDVSLKDDVYPIAVQILGELGGLDLMVNNASNLGPPSLRLLADTECEDLERALAANLVGPFRLTKAVLGALSASAREGRGGVVVNISSDAAVNPYPTWGAYSVSKAALRHLTAIWNAEMQRDGVQFLSIDPGDMDTPLHAQAVPDADRSALKRPADSARDVLAAIAEALPAPARR